MRAIEYRGPGAVALTERVAPEPRLGEVLVANDFAGICGSDLGIIAGTNPRVVVGQILGHESVATVRALGEGVTGLAVGDTVVPMPLISCGTCRPCLSGADYICEDLGLYGVDQPGALADRTVYPASVLYPIPPSVPKESAVLVEPLAVAVHAVARSGLRPGETVLVVGGGPVGTLCALVAAGAGSPVIVIEPNEHRRAMLADLELTAFREASADAAGFVDRRPGGGFDVVFEAAGIPVTADLALRETRVLGRTVIVGLQKGVVPFDLRAVNRLERTVIGSRVYDRPDFARAVELLATGDIDLSRFPRAVFDLSESAAALAEARSGSRSFKTLFAL